MIYIPAQRAKHTLNRRPVGADAFIEEEEEEEA